MRCGVLLLTALTAVGSGLAAMAAGSGNSANDRLLALPPDEQAAMLTKGIKGCAGESVFPMGVVTTASGKVSRTGACTARTAEISPFRSLRIPRPHGSRPIAER